MNFIVKSMDIKSLFSWGIAAMVAALCTAATTQSIYSQPVRRPLNPGTGSRGEHSAQDRAFRIAFDAANAGDFDTAAINYRRAFLAVHDPCEKTHALSGQTAALDAKALLRSVGGKSNPSQFFWLRIQELTKDLPCVWVR
jgi:hypothetical protein